MPRPALVLVDLQEDYLAERSLQPHRNAVIAGAVRLLAAARERGVPVLHVITTVHRDPDDRMPHWRKSGRWTCLAGTPGHASSAPVQPREGEPVFEKTGFSVLPIPTFLAAVSEQGCHTVILAGVHLHAGLRQLALELHQSGLSTWIAIEAVGSSEPSQAAQTEWYLREQGLRFGTNVEILAQFSGALEMGGDDAEDLPAVAIQGEEGPGLGRDEYLHRSPATGAVRWRSVDASPDQIARAVRAARGLDESVPDRIDLLRSIAATLENATGEFAEQIMEEVGKPIRYARAEVSRAAALFRAVAHRIEGDALEDRKAEALVRRRPLGNVVLVTPWSNPLAIAAGQLAPALAYGNAVLWKPARAGLAVAWNFYRLLRDAGTPAHAVQLVGGGEEAGLELLSAAGVGGVCFTGSAAAGRKVAARCGAANLPLQAGVGGNNGVIVYDDAGDLEKVALQTAEAAFGCSGQRCTATRRLIVQHEIHEEMISRLEAAMANLGWGAPDLESTSAGPLLNRGEVERVQAGVERARAEGYTVIQPRRALPLAAGQGAYYPPTLILCDEPRAEIAQVETFGPVLVVQRASSRQYALRLLNAVRQGLVAALYSQDARAQQRFLYEAQAGLLKLNRPTVDAGVDVPFGGWKESGSGTPQHGSANREFFTRAQSVYGLD